MLLEGFVEILIPHKSLKEIENVLEGTGAVAILDFVVWASGHFEEKFTGGNEGGKIVLCLGECGVDVEETALLDGVHEDLTGGMEDSDEIVLDLVHGFGPILGFLHHEEQWGREAIVGEI